MSSQLLTAAHCGSASSFFPYWEVDYFQLNCVCVCVCAHSTPWWVSAVSQMSRPHDDEQWWWKQTHAQVNGWPLTCFPLFWTHDWSCSGALQGVSTETPGGSDDRERVRGRIVMNEEEPWWGQYCWSCQRAELTELMAFSFCLLVQTHSINVRSKPSVKTREDRTYLDLMSVLSCSCSAVFLQLCSNNWRWCHIIH